MSDSATAFADDIKTLGEQIVGLTLKQAKELSDYLKEVHGIEAAAGGAVMMAPAADTVQLQRLSKPNSSDLGSFAQRKLDVVKVVKNITGAR